MASEDFPSMNIIARKDDGTETDVTEAVQVLYDTMHAFMGMASGSLDAEEWGAILHLAEAAEFTNLQYLRDQWAHERAEEEKRIARNAEYDRQRREATERGRAQALLALEADARIVAEMRAREPHLAQYADADLLKLDRMRKSGMA